MKKYKVIAYVRVEPDEEELFNSYEEAKKSYNDIEEDVIYRIEEEED